MFWAEFESALSTPYLYATYHDIDKLSTPSNEIFLLSDMGIGHRLHEVKDGGLGFAEEGSHDVERWSAIVGDGSRLESHDVQ
jgi:hypothetical protein